MTALDDVARAIVGATSHIEENAARIIGLAALRAYLASEPSAGEIEAAAESIARNPAKIYPGECKCRDCRVYRDQTWAAAKSQASDMLFAARRVALAEIEQEGKP